MRESIQKRNNLPLCIMEDYFIPGLKVKPAVYIGSQTIPFFHGIAEEQAFEGYFLSAASGRDLAIVRNFDPSYIRYWKQLIGDHYVINLPLTNPGEFLTQVILDDPKVMKEIKDHMDPLSRLHAFTPTRLEQDLAKKLGIPLHGRPEIGELYGTKSGIRELAKKYEIPMAPGFICKSVRDVEKAIKILRDHFTDAVIKYDHSLAGYFSKRVHLSDSIRVKELLDNIANGVFRDGEDTVVVEGWLNNKATPCAYIEILEDQDPIICAAWQQIVDEDGVTRIGAGPLSLSDQAMKSFLSTVNKLAWALKEKQAIGSYGPDFLITNDDETQFAPDTAVLLELNARIPATAIPLEIIRQTRGKIGIGFLVQHLKLESNFSFRDIAKKLTKEGILITKRGQGAKGVVPFNVGLLPWNVIDLVAMADTWNEAQAVMCTAQRVLQVSNTKPEPINSL